MNNTDNIDNTTDNTADKAPEPKEKEHFSPVASFYDLASVLASAFVLLTIIFTFVFRVVGVIGQSMENTVFENDWLITVQKEEYEYGDIVISTQPNYFNEPLIKRVIATGGQTVDIDYSTSTVYVDGVALDEPYRKEQEMSPSFYDISFPYQVPEGYLFVMGDNRNNSTDSRSELVGPIDERYILGKAEFRVLHAGNGFKIGDFNIYDYEQ